MHGRSVENSGVASSSLLRRGGGAGGAGGSPIAQTNERFWPVRCLAAWLHYLHHTCCLAACLPAPHCRVLMNDNGCRGARYLRRRTGCERSCCWRRSGGVAQRAFGEGGHRPPRPPPPQRGAAASVPPGPSPLLSNGIRTCAARGGLLQAQQGTAGHSRTTTAVAAG